MAPEAASSDNQPERLDEMLSVLEQKIDRLKVLYEQYFMGIEKIEPLIARKEVNRILLNLGRNQIRNTGLRFRYHTLVQRFNTFATYWNRILRQIEAGTYVRDLHRARRNMARRGVELPEEMLDGLDKRSRSALGRDEGRPSAAGATVAASPAAPGGGAPAPSPSAAARTVAGGMSMEQVETLYKRLVHAKRLCGESTSGLKLDALVATINRQAPKIMERHACPGVEFTVVLKNDKVILKAVPKKK